MNEEIGKIFDKPAKDFPGYPKPCAVCGEPIEPYQPGTSLSEKHGVIHTACLYAFKYGEEVPEILK